MHNVHISITEQHVAVLMLHRRVFDLSCKVVTLYLDNSKANHSGPFCLSFPY